MKFAQRAFVLLLLLFGFTACGTFKQTTLVDDKAYVILLGDPNGHVVEIDGGQPIHLGRDTSSFNLDGVTATKIQVSIGKHTIKVTKDNELRVKRAFYVATGNTFEVQL